MLTAYFSCKKCGIVKAQTQVPAREGPHQDVVLWMREIVIPALCLAHDEISPHCHPESLQDIMLPAEESAEFIGQQIE